MEGACFVSAMDRLIQDFGDVEELFAALFMISVGVAVILSPMYLMIYQAFVRMLMMVKNPDDTVEYSNSIAPGSIHALSVPTPTNNILAAMKSGYKRFNRTLILTLVFYAVSMIVLISTYQVIDARAVENRAVDWVEDILSSAIVVLLMVLPLLNQLFLPGWYRRVIGILLVIFTCGIGISLALDEGFEDIPNLVENFSLLVVVGLVVIGFAIQRIRNVAVQILLAMMVLLVSSFLYFFLLSVGADCLLPGMFGEVKPEISDVLTLFAVIVYFPFLYVVWKVLLYLVDKMVRAYERGYYSDFQLQNILWLLLITLLSGLALTAETQDDNFIDHRTAYAFLILALSVALYLALNWRRSVWKPARSLLYLRVFAKEKYSEYLFDHVAKHWRHIGPINMIGGPDFALMNLDIKEAYYLIFKRPVIHELFIDEPAALKERLATMRMSYLPSHDKQYTVNEFFCTDNMWQKTVTKLAAQTNHVLLDLRGFSNERKGAEFELHLLGEMNLLEHTTIVVDSHTDWDAIRGALEDLPDGDIPEHCVLEMKGAKIDARVIEYLAR